MLFAITGEVPDAVLSHRFGHERASLNATGSGVEAAGALTRCRSFATNGPTLRRFVDLSIANVNLNTELDFLTGAIAAFWRGNLALLQGSLAA